MTNIYFLENSFDYNASDLNSNKISGSEKTLINISNELGKIKDFKVFVFNNTSKKQNFQNVCWDNIKNITLNHKADFVIAMSDANLFRKLSCNNNYLWSHSVQNIEKFLRKKQLLPFLKYKPKLILEGRYHFETRGFLTSFYGKKIIKIAPDYDFINTHIDISFMSPKNAIFTTRSDRNLEILIDASIQIRKKNKTSKLFINPPFNLQKIHQDNEIYLRKKEDKNALINDLKNSRLFMVPGHKSEVFCLAAEEARELCVPIVTLGYGCLYERVNHGVTGFIANNKNEFIDYSNQILMDDSIFLELRKNIFNLRNSRNYTNVANDLINYLFKSK